jgi:hypothetical protein
MSMAEHDDEKWIYRFRAQLTLLQPKLEEAEIAAVAKDCLIWDGSSGPEVAAMDYSDAIEGRYVCHI